MRSAGLSAVAGYSFAMFQAKYGVQASDLSVSYVLTLLADVDDEPATLDLGYANDNGAGTARIVVPGGTLAGVSFVVPLPRDGGPVTVQSLQEHPAAAPGAPSGADKWALAALLGNTARLIATMLGERRLLAATGRDVAAQRHLLTARGGALDLIGDALAVPRLLPAPYRLDFDTDTVALYHFDDTVAPVLDATHEHPGVNHGAVRGAPGRLGAAAQIGPGGGITIPDAPDFTIAAGGSFTVEMFANLAALGAEAVAVLAAKRAYIGRSDGAGWALTATGARRGRSRAALQRHRPHRQPRRSGNARGGRLSTAGSTLPACSTPARRSACF